VRPKVIRVDLAAIRSAKVVPWADVREPSVTAVMMLPVRLRKAVCFRETRSRRGMRLVLVAALAVSIIGCKNMSSVRSAKDSSSEVIRKEHDAFKKSLLDYKTFTRRICDDLRKEISPAELRTWAVKEIDATPAGQMRIVGSAWSQRLTAALKEPFEPMGIVVHNESSVNPFISVTWGGAATYYGLRIGRESYEPQDKFAYYVQCEPGIYAWHVLPPGSIGQ